MPDLNVLFSPCRLNDLDLATRVVMVPVTRSFSPDRAPTAEVGAYYCRCAENGVGLIITEGTAVGRPAALNEPDSPHFRDEAALAGWKKMMPRSARGGRIASQLRHVGQKRSKSEATPLVQSPQGSRGRRARGQ